jgi:uncharacterized protein (TIGR03083 family)
MSTDPHVERCLAAIRTISEALGAELAAMSPSTWESPTNCPPWLVRDLVSHVVSSGEGAAAAIRQGLAGVIDAGITREARAELEAALAAAGPAQVAVALAAITDQFAGLYTDLDEAGLSAICFHRRGNRPARWYAVHRLAEVAFHAWDLHLSLGETPDLSDDVAALMLPTLLESNAPRTYAAGLTPQRGTGERYLLAVADAPTARWLVTVSPDALTAVRGDAPADLTITGSAAALALMVYGRRDLSALFQARAVWLDGDAALADRFALIFPRP